MNLLLLLGLTHLCFPRARTTTRKFFELSYYDAASGRYTQGWDDFPFVLFGVIVFTALRAATMDYVLKPLARMGGIQKKKATVRFAEQGWLLIYCSIFWSLGMVRLLGSTHLKRAFLKIEVVVTTCTDAMPCNRSTSTTTRRIGLTCTKSGTTSRRAP